MKQYIDLVKYVLEKGSKHEDRTGIGTLAIFGYQFRHDLNDGFPLLTSKKVIFESVVRELLWIISGSTNVKDLHPCKIWDAWADEHGDLGPVYGKQWRKWSTTLRHSETIEQNFIVDQLSRVISQIKNNPDSRRHIISAWNVSDIDKMALPPCHCFFQFNVDNDYLDLQLYQRSADIAIGVPFNIASYALLLLIIANECNLKARNFVHTFGNAHIYNNHIDGLKEQISRTLYDLPNVTIAKESIYSLKPEHFTLSNYKHHDFIKFDIAV